MAPTPDVPADADADAQLVDFGGVPSRLRAVGVVLAALALLGCVVDGVLNGLTFALMGRWVGIFAAGLLVATALTTAIHALGGADRAGKRGERLSSPDVGISPRRLAPVDDAAAPSTTAPPTASAQAPPDGRPHEPRGDSTR